MFRPLLLAAVWLAAASVATSCGSTRACKNNTLLVTVTLDSAAAMADKLIIAVTVGSGTPKMNTLDHTPGQASGTVEIDFPNGYPTGQKVNVGVTATHAGAPVGSGSADSTLSDGCEAVSVSVKGGAGGTGGNGGTGTGGSGTAAWGPAASGPAAATAASAATAPRQAARMAVSAWVAVVGRSPTAARPKPGSTAPVRSARTRCAAAAS